MKDSYSFDVDDAGLREVLRPHRDAYIKIFDRLGFEYVIVHAMSGAMGGSASEEFLAVAENGEDTFVRSPGGYAANVEAVRDPAAAEPLPYDDAPAAHVEDTPDTPTIDTLVAVPTPRFPRPDRPWTAADTLKNVVVMITERTAPGTRWSSACPATATSTSSGWPHSWSRPRRKPSPTRTSTDTRAGQGLHRPGQSRGGHRRARSATWSTRGWSAAPGGSPAPTRTAARLRPGLRPRLHSPTA